MTELTITDGNMSHTVKTKEEAQRIIDRYFPEGNNLQRSESKIIRDLIHERRKQLQDDRAALRKADELSDRQAELIASELEELRMLEIKNRGVSL